MRTFAKIEALIMQEQLSLFDSASPKPKSSITKPVIEQKIKVDAEYQSAKYQHIQRFLSKTTKDVIACVGKYKVKGKHEYFRLSYRHNGKVKHIHLQGGNTNSKLANYRAEQLRVMIERGAELSEVLAAIDDFNR